MKRALRSNEEIIHYLIAREPIFEAIITANEDIDVELSDNYFEFLVSAIVGQQLSNRVVEILWKRVVLLLDEKISPERVIETDEEDFRRIGISYAKIGYLKNLSRAVMDQSLNLSGFDEMDDETIIQQLTAVKGIGRWTAEMFLIFSLGRVDVFSTGDGGLQRSIQKMYRLEECPDKKELLKISSNWSPYRTYASLYLWKSLDGGGLLL